MLFKVKERLKDEATRTQIDKWTTSGQQVDNKWATSGQQVDNKWTTVRGNCSLYPSGLPYLNGSKYICRFTFTFTLTGAKTSKRKRGAAVCCNSFAHFEDNPKTSKAPTRMAQLV